MHTDIAGEHAEAGEISITSKENYVAQFQRKDEEDRGASDIVTRRTARQV